jgi:hypothetical protein
MMIITSGAALLALCGCGDDGSGTGANSGNSAVGSFRTPDGRSEVRAGDAALSGLPDGIPPYPNADTSGAIQFGGISDGGEARVMGFQTADQPSQVIDFYAAAAARAGFRETHRATSGPAANLGLERDNGEVMSVTATGTPRGTQVQIMVGQERRRG